MANELLDFVMSLVNDPAAAAAYAENPDQAIADAHLANVTSADVGNLIPVVSESLSSAVPSTGADSFGGIGEAAHNVWSSGAATAAFDAFDDHLPVNTVDSVHSLSDAALPDDVHSVITDYADQPDHGMHQGLDALSDVGAPDVAGADDSLHFDHPIIDDSLAAVDAHSADLHADPNAVHSIVQVDDMDSDPSGFDLF